MKNTNLKRFLIGIGLFLVTLNLFAQQEITVTGKVIDGHNEPLIGVAIVVKNQPGLGTTTDFDGNYKIKAGANDVLVFSFWDAIRRKYWLMGKSNQCNA